MKNKLLALFLGFIIVSLSFNVRVLELKNEEVLRVMAEEPVGQVAFTYAQDEPAVITDEMRAKNPKSTEIFDKGVFVLDIDPIIEKQNSQRLSKIRGNQETSKTVEGVAEWFRLMSKGRVDYRIHDITKVDYLPPKSVINVANEDGSYLKESTVKTVQYTDDEYLDCIANGDGSEECDFVYRNIDASEPKKQERLRLGYVDIVKLLDDQKVCERFNDNEFDELWIDAPPFLRFNETALVGPGAFFYNGPSHGSEAVSCNRLMPIVIFNKDRVGYGGHIFGHRSEATLLKMYNFNIYGSREQYALWKQEFRPDENTPMSRMFLFSEGKAAVPYGSCGDIHFPPNTDNASSWEYEYDYDNTQKRYTTCDNFKNYPNIEKNWEKLGVLAQGESLESDNPSTIIRPISCEEWGCVDESMTAPNYGFYGFWYNSMPQKTGKTEDGYYMDWWKYMFDVNSIYEQKEAYLSYSVVNPRSRYKSGDEIEVSISLAKPTSSFYEIRNIEAEFQIEDFEGLAPVSTKYFSFSNSNNEYLTSPGVSIKFTHNEPEFDTLKIEAALKNINESFNGGELFKFKITMDEYLASRMNTTIDKGFEPKLKLKNAKAFGERGLLKSEYVAYNPNPTDSMYSQSLVGIDTDSCNEALDEDINCDGFVNWLDYNLVQAQYLKSRLGYDQNVPEEYVQRMNLDSFDNYLTTAGIDDLLYLSKYIRENEKIFSLTPDSLKNKKNEKK